MLIVFLAAEQCKDTYVRSCTPAPKTPASEVVVDLGNILATTGGDNLTGLVTLAVFLVVGSGVLFAYNELRKRERNRDE